MGARRRIFLGCPGDDSLSLAPLDSSLREGAKGVDVCPGDDSLSLGVDLQPNAVTAPPRRRL